jgi:hypothetical protein
VPWSQHRYEEERCIARLIMLRHSQQTMIPVRFVAYGLSGSTFQC